MVSENDKKDAGEPMDVEPSTSKTSKTTSVVDNRPWLVFVVFDTNLFHFMDYT